MHEKINYISDEASVSRGAKQSIIDHLQDESLHEKIRSNHITLAMIRPQSEHSVNFTTNGRPVEEVLEEHIESLGVHTKISMTLDDEAITDFYSDTVSRQLQKPPEVTFVMRNRWCEFQHLMTSGLATVALLESQDATAVETWRSQLGHWNIEESRDPTTLRGKFGVHNHNNLFHGSDSPESALQELHIIINCLKRARR